MTEMEAKALASEFFESLEHLTHDPIIRMVLTAIPLPTIDRHGITSTCADTWPTVTDKRLKPLAS